MKLEIIPIAGVYFANYRPVLGCLKLQENPL